MEEKERVNIIRVLGETVKAIRVKDVKVLKELSNETVHDASIEQSHYSITIAVLVYSLSKVFEREFNYKKDKGWNQFCYDCFDKLEKARKALVEDEIDLFEKTLREFIESLKKLDLKLKTNIEEVMHKARINKASRIYEHGISLGRTAELLGISRFELMDYIGKTGISNVDENMTLHIKKRLNFARGLFK